jgi:hypothetical protein
MKHVLTRLLCLLLAGGGLTACAQSVLTVTFDDLPAPSAYGSLVPAGYAGIQWNNFNYIIGSSFIASGFQNGVVSGMNAAFNGSGDPAQISGPGVFDLTSAWLTSAWNDGLQVEVQGFLGGNLNYDNTYILNATAPTLIQFNYLNVDTVNFISSGGVNHGYGGSGTQFVMDDLTVVVPEPGVTPILIIGLTGIYGHRRWVQRQRHPRLVEK